MADLKPLTDEQFQMHAFLRQLRTLRKQIAEMECAVVGMLQPKTEKRKAADDDYFTNSEGKQVRIKRTGRRL